MPIQKLNHTHDRIIDWLLMNPQKPLSECAQHFGYTQPWLSTVINSDMFQAVYRERSAQLGEECVHGISTKLKSIAYMSLERTQERLADKPTDRFVVDSGRLALQALGYFTQHEQTIQQHLHLHANVNAEVLLQARDRLAQASQAQAPPQKIIDGDISGAAPAGGGQP